MSVKLGPMPIQDGGSLKGWYIDQKVREPTWIAYEIKYVYNLSINLDLGL